MSSTVRDRAFESPALLWIGRLLSGLVVLFLLFDASIKLIPLDMVIQGSREFGIPVDLNRTLGLLILICTVLYVFPRTSVLGAVLMTGYLGGAVYVHLAHGSPLFSHVLFGVYIGILMWGGLYLRDPQLRALFPIRR